jgi:hypothetical protein
MYVQVNKIKDEKGNEKGWAVRVVETVYQGGVKTTRLIKYIGSAQTRQELNRLLGEAQKYINRHAKKFWYISG